MIQVFTKQIRAKNWCCLATINGCDYSFSDTTMRKAQKAMIKKLKSIGKFDYSVWENTEPLKVKK